MSYQFLLSVLKNFFFFTCFRTLETSKQSKKENDTMKKIYLIVPVVLGIVIIAYVGCVPKSKYVELENQNVNCETREQGLTKQLSEKNSDIETLTSQVDALSKENSDFKNNLSNSATEQQNLNEMLQAKIADLEAREKTIQDLQSLIDKQKQTVTELLERLKKALVNFSSEELTIEVKNGKVYIAMSDQLLFSSGSTKIDDKGKNALGKLAEVIQKQPEIDIFIEGHTDSVPIKTSRYKDNWDLSVMRATSVIRVLLIDYEVNPKQLIPSGRSEFFPIASNETKDGKARNRRTEIILSPNLDELFTVIQGDKA